MHLLGGGTNLGTVLYMVQQQTVVGYRTLCVKHQQADTLGTWHNEIKSLPALHAAVLLLCTRTL